ncbi:MAG TPA: hypothetical protein VNC50_16550, partial [Planctomycetia bacterium]|nr:hypothetical protein [Planctomycetia bacterium]
VPAPPARNVKAVAFTSADVKHAARTLLDKATPATERTATIEACLPLADEVVREMAANMPADAEEEYRRIPAIWQVSIAAAKKNDGAVLKRLLAVSLPAKGDKLRDWQAVVIGGGIINGISQLESWPKRRLADLTKDDPALAGRWQGALENAIVMAENGGTPPGTRYDALRIVALSNHQAAGAILKKHLAKDAHAELQMGSVSGLVDVETEEAGKWLAAALPDLASENRKLAIAGLLRTPARAKLFLDMLEAKKANLEWVPATAHERLLKMQDGEIRRRVERVFGK